MNPITGSNAFTREQPYLQVVYPDHGGKGKAGQYVPDITRLRADEGSALFDKGFSLISELAYPTNTFSDKGVFKRTDSMGRVIMIDLCSHNIRVTHAYLNHTLHTTFDITTEYATAILNGRDNEWLFLEFPQETTYE